MLKKTDAIEKKLTLVMPVFNDHERVIPVISTLFITIRYPFQLIVVYDSDTDGTIAVVKKLQEYFPEIILLQNEWKKGVLNAIKTGLKHANTPYVGIWASYHVDPYCVVNDMVDKLDSGYDLVSVTRFSTDKFIARGNPIKKLLSFGGNLILHSVIGMPVTDVTTSLKVYKKELLDTIEIETIAGWAVSAELSIKAAINGYRLTEIPLQRKNVNLIHGITNFSIFKQSGEYFRWLYLGFQMRRTIKKHQVEIAEKNDQSV
ncbi:MAG: glycosyltransferase family 2 protein [Nitrospira sp.]|nr:glycosyltransferase family 2 protein [Candidatus Brocadiales bacterium]MBL7050288.1 glycosyltransferase family 2 protein [Nitrospira sp.]